jgi:hypothetical protein
MYLLGRDGLNLTKTFCAEMELAVTASSGEGMMIQRVSSPSISLRKEIMRK